MSYSLWLEDVTIRDVPRVGGKNASLGEMIRTLTKKDVAVPGGFCTTAVAYKYYVKATGLEAKLRAVLAGLNVEDIDALAIAGSQARELILKTPFPQDLVDDITAKYLAMCERYGDAVATAHGDAKKHFEGSIACAVRSSATAEDLPDASFAGQQETFLNVQGVSGILEATLKCFASLFTNRAISYRVIQGYDHFDVSLAVGIQKMVRSDLACSGVIFTVDTESGFKDAVIVTGSYGLGETVVQGTVNPDEFVVFKPTLALNKKPILHKSLGSKEVKMIYGTSKSHPVKTVPVFAADRSQYCLKEAEVLKLARWGVIIEEHYSEAHGRHCPMDIEWAKDGVDGQLYIVQARPETVQSRKSTTVIRSYNLNLTSAQKAELKPVITGKSVGQMIGTGRACVVADVASISLFRKGDVLITERTDPDWEPIMKQASAIVTSQGGRTCHAAIIARELGIPAVVGCGNATELVVDGVPITVDCADGEVGFVYAGEIPFTIKEVELSSIPETKTKIMMNVGNPSDAFKLSFMPNKGVGLCRLEFIIANHITIHPLALLNFDTLEDKVAKAKIAEMTTAYPSKKDYFVEKLAAGIATIAAAFYPNDVVVRMSDLKTNEYASLIGGAAFEPAEENPMIGWRGASRYYDPKYRAAFDLECQALYKVRELMGLTNVIPMIPFCRTPEEGRKVLAVMSANKLNRGENGLQVYVMCEIPSNVILAEDFCDVFDGFSIGSNDLTQLTLGLDRDSALVSHLFDERSPAVKRMISNVIRTAKARGRKIGICGQAPSDYPEFARFLVEEGIDSISLNPDSVIKTMLDIAELEKTLAVKAGRGIISA